MPLSNVQATVARDHLSDIERSLKGTICKLSLSDGAQVTSSTKGLFRRAQICGSTNLNFRVGDILKTKADCLVNPANEYLAHNGGLAGQIRAKVGVQFDQDSQVILASRDNNRLACADAEVVDASQYNLIVDYVMHVVPPMQKQASWFDLLEMAYASVLRKAKEHGFRSLLVPLLGAGVFGIKPQYSTNALMRAITAVSGEADGMGTLEDIHLVNNDIYQATQCASAFDSCISTVRTHSNVERWRLPKQERPKPNYPK
jgi:O-acetyl-ADP-ribose deacetylase (regulator of RNase III)